MYKLIDSQLSNSENQLNNLTNLTMSVKMPVYLPEEIMCEIKDFAGYNLIYRCCGMGCKNTEELHLIMRDSFWSWIDNKDGTFRGKGNSKISRKNTLQKKLADAEVTGEIIDPLELEVKDNSNPFKAFYYCDRCYCRFLLPYYGDSNGNPNFKYGAEIVTKMEEYLLANEKEVGVDEKKFKTKCFNNARKHYNDFQWGKSNPDTLDRDYDLFKKSRVKKVQKRHLAYQAIIAPIVKKMIQEQSTPCKEDRQELRDMLKTWQDEYRKKNKL